LTASFGVIRSSDVRTFPRLARAATGYCSLLLSRGSKKVPLPCISRFATNAFQYVTVPQEPVQVCWFTPASPKAAGFNVAADFPSGRNVLPSSSRVS
jgi:hypothetical protein